LILLSAASSSATQKAVSFVPPSTCNPFAVGFAKTISFAFVSTLSGFDEPSGRVICALVTGCGRLTRKGSPARTSRRLLRSWPGQPVRRVGDENRKRNAQRQSLSSVSKPTTGCAVGPITAHDERDCGESTSDTPQLGVFT